VNVEVTGRGYGLMVVIAIVVVGVLEVTDEIEIHSGLDISQSIDTHYQTLYARRTMANWQWAMTSVRT
jgi:translation initiation factor 2 gamma subunit (eIF-2gamma)